MDETGEGEEHVRERLAVILVALLIGGVVGGGGILFIARSADHGLLIEGHAAGYWVKCLDSDDESVRDHAVIILPRFGADGVWAVMTVLGNTQAQDGAVEVLVRIGQPAVSPLNEALLSRSPQTRVGAIRALDKMPPPLVAPASERVSRLLDDDAASPFASQFLCRIGPDAGAIAAALQISETGSVLREVDALHVLGHASGSDAHVVEMLRQRSDDADPHVQAAAFEALCGLTPPSVDAASLMIDHLTRTDSRAAARIGLARLSSAAIEPLHSCTTRPAIETRIEAIGLLAQYVTTDKSAAIAIVDFVHDADASVGTSAEAALAPMREHDLTFVKKQLASPYAKVRIWAIHEVRKVQPPLIDDIAPLLDDRDEQVRNEATEAIRGLWQADDPIILFAPKSKDLQEKLRGIRLLPFFRDPRKYDMMLAAMEDAQPEVRLEATRAMGRSLTSGRVVTRLVEAMKQDPIPQIRAEAATYLTGARSTSHVEEALDAATRDPDATVAEAARRSLARHNIDK